MVIMHQSSSILRIILCLHLRITVSWCAHHTASEMAHCVGVAGTTVWCTSRLHSMRTSSWSIDGEHTAVVAVAELELAGKGSNAILIFDHSRSMKKDDGAGYSSSFEALYHCLIDTFLSLKSSRDFLRPRAKSPTRIYSVVTLISMSDAVTVEIHTIRTVAHAEARDNQQSCTALARQLHRCTR